MFLFQAKRPWNAFPIAGWKLPQGVWNLCWCDSVGLPTNSDMMWYRTNKQWLRACCIHIQFAQAPTQNKQQVKHWTEVALFGISFYQYTPVSPAHDFHNWDWGSSQMISYTNGENWLHFSAFCGLEFRLVMWNNVWIFSKPRVAGTYWALMQATIGPRPLLWTNPSISMQSTVVCCMIWHHCGIPEDLTHFDKHDSTNSMHQYKTQ